ncbi:MAG: FG-GAP repeat domain-containing protein [Verrucomicrobiota bacterium]
MKGSASSPAIGRSRGWLARSVAVGVVVSMVVAPDLAVGQKAAEPVAPTSPPAPLVALTADPLARGRELARVHCQGCHLQPDPDQLDRATWYSQTLPRMSIRLGFMPQSIERHPEADLLKASGRFATSPFIPLDDWRALTNYYVSSAPEQPLPQARSQPIRVGLKSFRVEPGVVAPGVTTGPETTLVCIDASQRRLMVGDGARKSLEVRGPDGALRLTQAIGNVPVGLSFGRGLSLLASIGSFMPSDRPVADLRRWEAVPTGGGAASILLDHLPRVTQATVEDLNGDGREDLLLCAFGNVMGRFAWHENLGGGKFTEHVLLEKPGAIAARVLDFNGDGRPDIGVLVAQETESFLVFVNEGGGRFTQKVGFQRSPLFGHTSIDVADFDGDGRPDLVVTNGDNGEYPSPIKRYHGIRIYMGRPDLTFREVFFYPLNGAFKALVRDFDQDGHPEIAAISFFPDYSKSPEEGFVCLENRGNFRFSAATFRECLKGRWLTLDAGDIDGDGDEDLVLGSHIHGPSPVPEKLQSDWERERIPFVILRNTTVDRKGP